MQRSIVHGITFLVSIVPGFYLAGPLVFADGPLGERMPNLLQLAGLYLVLGMLLGWWQRTWIIGLVLAAPAVLTALLMGEGDLRWITAATLLLGTGGGAGIGASLRRRRT